MRIASLSPAATEILFQFGLGNQIVCTDQFSNFPEDAKELPHVRDMVKIDPKHIAEFKPDIVLLGTSIQTRLAEELRKNDFSVVHDDPRTIEDIFSWIRSLGSLFEREKQAEQLVLHMRQEFNNVKKKAALLPKKSKLYIEEWHNPPFASANWVPELVRIAGGMQITSAISGELSPEVTLEQVQSFDPDLIVISWCGAGSLADPKLLRDRQGWDTIRAVQEGNVRVIDDSLLNRPGPRLVDGTQRLFGWMFEYLHS